MKALLTTSAHPTLPANIYSLSVYPKPYLTASLRTILPLYQMSTQARFPILYR